MKSRNQNIVPFFDGGYSEEWKTALAEADSSIGLADGFYREEWTHIVQEQGIHTIGDYYKARRTGRGTKLNRADREKVWPVFDKYRQLLGVRKLVEPEDAMQLAANILGTEAPGSLYAGVVVDEAQDMGSQAFRLLRAIAGDEKQNDIFVVGDAHQRIYGRKAVLGRCGINIRGRARKLRLNYRTTEEIRKASVGILTGLEIDDLDGGLDNNKGYRSLLHGIKPQPMQFGTFDQQMDFISQYLKNELKEGRSIEEICIVSRHQNYLEQIASRLRENKIPVCLVKTDADEDAGKGVRMATMHRVKGLEYSAMLVAGLHKDQFPSIANDLSDEISRKSAESGERALLYVSMTRAKCQCILMAHGEVDGMLEGLGLNNPRKT